MIRPLTEFKKIVRSEITEPIILCAADDNYVKPLAVTLQSAAMNIREGASLRVIVLDGGISEANWIGLNETFADLPIEVFSIQPDLGEVSELGISHHITHTAYFRLFAGRLLPDSIDKVIYLDSDLLVQGDISELWEADLADNFALAVPDVACPFIDSRHAECNFSKSSPYFAAITPIANWKELGLKPSARYFNSGVMVLNIKRMREESIGQRLLNCLLKNQKYVWCWDQYALNVVFAGQWQPLPLKWNQGAHVFEFPSPAHCPVNDEEFLEALEQPAIIHYTTEWKPWDYDSSHPLKDRFFAQLDETAWAGWRPEKPPFSFSANWQRFATEFVKQWVIHYRKIASMLRPSSFSKPANAIAKIESGNARVTSPAKPLTRRPKADTQRRQLRELVTFFTTPRSFEKDVAVAQENAIASWRRLADVILVGDEFGIAEAAVELDVQHIAEVQKNESLTPLLSSAFERVRQQTTTPYLVFCNADIILFDEFADAILDLVEATPNENFVATGRRTTVAVDGRVNLDEEQTVSQLKDQAERFGRLDSLVCKDFFVFPRELYLDMPAFAVGRGNWDNWMIHNAKQNNVPVISLTQRILALHQKHAYSHVGNRYSAYVSGKEARENQKLAGGRHLISGSTPDYFLGESSLRPARMSCINGEFWIDFPRFVHLLMNFVGLR